MLDYEENYKKESKPKDRAATSAMASTASGGGNAMDIGAAGMIMSGNPYAMAGGLALSTLSHGAKKREAEAKYNYEVQQKAKIAKKQNELNALSRLISVGQGMRNLA